MHAILSYIRHWLTAVNGHSLHTPFMFDFYTRALKGKEDAGAFAPIEKIREGLLTSREKITVCQLGAASKVNNQQVRPVAAIAARGMTPAATSRLFTRIIRHYNYQTIVELGTSFGLNTLYLAATPATRVYTFEGCPNTAKIARHNFAATGVGNIELIAGNIDQTLPDFCQKSTEKIDLVFLDANHNYTPTLQYVEWLLPRCHKNSMMIIDDIHWSPAMTRAWQKLQAHPQVTTTIDLYQLGILLFRPGLKKAHYRLQG